MARSARPPRLTLAAVAAVTVMAAVTPAMPQPASCTVSDAPNPLRRIYQCQEELRVAAEASTRVASIERAGRIVGFRIEGGAALVDTGRPRPEGFQVITPDAVVEVRGTRFAVDVGAGRTSVFVRQGSVAVRGDAGAVTLGPGEGVDVMTRSADVAPSPPPSGPSPPMAPPPPGASPMPEAPRRERGVTPSRPSLEARRWPAERATELLARLGER